MTVFIFTSTSSTSFLNVIFKAVSRSIVQYGVHTLYIKAHREWCWAQNYSNMPSWIIIWLTYWWFNHIWGLHVKHVNKTVSVIIPPIFLVIVISHLSQTVNNMFIYYWHVVNFSEEDNHSWCVYSMFFQQLNEPFKVFTNIIIFYIYYIISDVEFVWTHDNFQTITETQILFNNLHRVKWCCCCQCNHGYIWTCQWTYFTKFSISWSECSLFS